MWDNPFSSEVPSLGGIPPMGGISEFLVGNGRLRNFGIEDKYNTRILKLIKLSYFYRICMSIN